MRAWMQTYGGRMIDLLDPDPALIDIQDIAVSLSRICRFNGHCAAHYSVADHSARVALECVCDPLAALLHDAHEAYLGDITRPARQAIDSAGLVETARRLDAAIGEAFGIDPDRFHSPEVKRADNVLLATELRDLMHSGIRLKNGNDQLPEPLAERIVPHTPDVARQVFLLAWEKLRK